MDARRILRIQGHPDPSGARLGHALARACAQGAVEAGHALRRVEVAALAFPLLRTQGDWEHGRLPPALAPARRDIVWAQHRVRMFPLWMGDMPALLKGFLEQVARPGLAGEGLSPASSRR
jgi:putative NADPH-quinone reductase